MERNDGENAKRVAQRLMSIARGDIGGAADSVAAIKLLDVLLKDENRALGDSNTPEGGALLRTIRVIDVSFDARLQVPPVPGLVIDVPKRPDTATEDANT
ncbi:MAG: hypothetical protein EKK62_09630 [Acidimicrobiia bacterium]|nr:MAG: hypothetical protein EKK62_09630 [Acidimicrobiia bacterium]